MTDNSLVTVYLPTYNRVRLLERAVNSVLAQSYKNIELIIVNDASTDDTQVYLDLLVSRDSRVRCFTNKESKKACYSRNIAIKNATGDFITGLDDDDFFGKYRIESFLSDWDGNAVALYSNSTIISKNFKIKINRPTKIHKNDLLLKNFVGNQIFTRTRILKNTNFDERMSAWQDLDTWYELLKQPSSYMKLSNHNSYYIDQSHGSVRISNDILKIKLAIEIFSEKNNLSKQERSIINLQILPYSDNLNILEKIISYIYKYTNSVSIVNEISKIYKLL